MNRFKYVMQNIFPDKLSAYIIIKWLTIFITAAISLYALALLGDIANNLLRNKLTFLEILQQLLFNSAMVLKNVFPVSCLLASLFLINTLKQHSELIALLASGYSLMRMAMVCIVVGAFVAFLQFINLGFWEPHLTSQKKTWSGSKGMSNAAVISQNKIWIKHKNYFGYYQFFDHLNNTMIEPNLYFYNDVNKPVKFVRAAKAIYRENTDWEFVNTTVIDNLDKNQFPLITRAETLKIPLYETPATISEFEADLRSLNIINLYNFLRHVKDTGINLRPYYLQVYESITQALLCLIFTLFPFAFPMGISARHQSSGKALLYGLLVSVSFILLNMLFIKFFTYLYLPPLLSSLLFPTLALIYLFRRLWPKVPL